MQMNRMPEAQRASAMHEVSIWFAAHGFESDAIWAILDVAGALRMFMMWIFHSNAC